MRLLEALEILRQPSVGNPYPVYLACGFTPLDLKTFLAAHLRLRVAGHHIEVRTGLFGDLAGSLEQAFREDGAQAIFAVIEWTDLDPRLGLRSAGGWLPEHLPDIARTVEFSLSRLAAILESPGRGAVVAVSLPTLTPAPVFHEPPRQWGHWQWTIEAAVASFAARIAGNRGVRIVSPGMLGAASPVSARLDAQSELSAGFPYTRAHASALAGLLVDNALPPVAEKKGLITDLDDTFWRGILGEAGVDGVAWDLDHGAQGHGLYQKTLAALAVSGVLVAVASKNDPELAATALGRADLLATASSFYPVEANWGPKSVSVARILKTWNIAADAVVFIDDSPMELAEVAQAHPGIETLRFPKDAPGLVALLTKLRELFGRQHIGAEDRLRAASLRAAGRQVEAGASANEEFLSGAEAVVTLDTSNPPVDQRPLELVNKTNQFNLNGRRYSEAQWSSLLGAPDAFLVVTSYRDRFGPLGRIAVIAGRREGKCAHVDCWVMSCRAFSRRIEHRTLEYLFEVLDIETVELAYRATERNGPLREFLESLGSAGASGPLLLERAQFRQACPVLYHQVEVLSHA
jgi:FkbH-like protein